MLNEKDFYVCIVAISSLAQVYIKFIEQGEKPQLHYLENMLNHPNTYVGIAAASSLADVYCSFALRGEDEYLEKLEDLLESENRDLVKASANSLVNVYSILIERNQKQYLNRLEGLLNNEDPDVSQATSKALSKIIVNMIAKKKDSLQRAVIDFENILKERLNAFLKGSFSSEIKIDSNLVKIGHLELKRNKVLEIPVCVFTESSFNIIKTIALGYKLRHPVLLLGPTSTGKSFLIKWLATLLGYEHLSYTLNPYLSKFELIGGMKPDKKGRFVWQDGIILKAAKEGKWLVLEEINLASSEIIEVLNDYLTTGKITYSQNGQQKQIIPAPNFAIFATANPESYSQRQKLSKVFLSRWKIYYQKELAESEMAEILSTLFKVPSSIALMIARFHKTLEKQAQAKVIGKEEKDPYIYSLRDIIRVGKRVSVLLKSNLSDKEFFKQLFWELYTVYLARIRNESERQLLKSNLSDKEFFKQLFWELYTVYLARIRNESERQALISSLDAHFGFKMKGLKLEEIIDGQRKKITFLFNEIRVTKGDEFIPQTEADIIPTRSQEIIVTSILYAIKYNEPVLLVGMPASGKTTLIRYLAKQKQTNLFYINLSLDTGLEELLGGYVQDEKGRWYYRKGMLFKAVEEGFWLLVDEANLS
ncbi:MAG: AAA family ATPase, partial [Candidatus Desulfofervidus sp.]|nr:AAA family ATPase [Candidatus Desulfofervidus sp.]